MGEFERWQEVWVELVENQCWVLPAKGESVHSIGGESSYRIAIPNHIHCSRVQYARRILRKQFGREGKCQYDEQRPPDKYDTQIPSLLCRSDHLSPPSIHIPSVQDDLRFPPSPSSRHVFQVLFRPLGPTPSGNGPTLSPPVIELAPRLARGFKRSFTFVEDDAVGRSRWVANFRLL